MNNLQNKKLHISGERDSHEQGDRKSRSYNGLRKHSLIVGATLAVALLTIALMSNALFLFLLSPSTSAHVATTSNRRTSVHVAVTGNGRIYGQLLDGTKNNAPLVGQTVTLQVAQLGNGNDLATATTDAHGNYNFPSLSTDKTLNYAVYIHYQNAQYVSNIVTLDSKPVQQLNLTVYDATSDSSKLAIVDSTILIHEPDTQKGIITVSEFFDFENLNRYTYVGSLDASKGKPNALLFSLPVGARNVVLSQGFGGYNVIQVDRGFASNVALLPGTSQLAFSFNVPYSSTSYDLSYMAFYPTVSVSVLVPPDLQANSALLTSSGLITSNNQPYRVLKGSNLLTNQGFRVALNGLHLPASTTAPQFNTGLIWLVVAVLLMCAIILVTAFVYRWQSTRSGHGSRGKAKQGPEKTDKRDSTEKHTHPGRKSGGKPRDEQEALLKELLTLDKSHEAGKLSKAEYQARRSKIKARLRELMREQETAHR